MKKIHTIDGDKTEEELILSNFTYLCNAIKATNPVASPTLLLSRLTYEQNKEWIDKLDANVCIIKQTDILKGDDNIWIVPYGWKNGRYYD